MNRSSDPILAEMFATESVNQLEQAPRAVKQLAAPSARLYSDALSLG